MSRVAEGELGAIEKTKALLRLDLPIGLLVKNEENPNKMTQRAFDLLCDNFEKTGITDPILRACRSTCQQDAGRRRAGSEGRSRSSCSSCSRSTSWTFRIVGGHHRYDAAAYIGFEEVPVTVIMDPEFDEEQERFQLVRMNAIRGKLDPQAFFKLVFEAVRQVFRRDHAGRLRLRRGGGVQAADRPDRQDAARQGAAGEVQGGGAGDQDGRRPVEAPERDVHQVRRHAAVRLHDLRLRRPAVDVAQDRGQDHEGARPDRRPLHRATTARSTTSWAASCS